MKNTYTKSALAVAFGIAAMAAQGQTFVTAVGATNGVGDGVNAKAIFTVNAGAGTVTVNLFNLLTTLQVKNVGQNLSDISFTLSGSGFSNAAISNSSPYQDQFVNIGSGGVVTLQGTSNSLGWGLQGSNGNYTLEDLGFAGPKNTLVGGTAGSMAAYTNANSSIAGNGPHNNFIQGEADWVINVAGLTANTTVTSATFSFGTTLGDNVPGVPAPEPATFVGLGIGAIVLIRRRRK